MARKKNDEQNNGKIIEISRVVNSKGKEINIVARSIRKYRELRGLEQKQLSRMLGVSDSSVANWETGFSKPTLEVLVPVAKILGISLYELFGLDDPMMQYSKQEQKVFAKYKDLNEYHRAAVSTRQTIFPNLPF